MNLTIENPAVLILGAIFSALPLKNRYQLIVVQKLVLFYLACALINLISDEYFTISLWRWSINVSYGILGVFFLCGMVFLKKKTITKSELRLYSEILIGWAIAFGIIVAHMAMLFLTLKWFYGYGYEHDLKSIGAVCGCFILFLCMWHGLTFRWVRLLLGIIFAVAISIIAKGGPL